VSRIELPSPTFSSRLRDERTTAIIGRWLGIAFSVCFLTGLLSHLHQHPLSWLPIPSRPVWGYQVSQGLHIVTGLASVPLLLAKLWSVYPKLFARPAVRSLGHGLERVSIAALVAASIFQLATGTANIALWYPWPFYFPTAHFWMAWVAIGALCVHLGVKWPVILAALRRPREPLAADLPGPGLSRRGLLGSVVAAVGVVTVTTVGQTFSPLRPLAILAPRKPADGPTGLPVNRTAAAAGVTITAASNNYRLVVAGPRQSELSLAELRALPQYEAELPIACVQGWSASARWGGVRLRDLLDRAGVPVDADIRVISLDLDGLYGSSRLGTAHARDPLTLLALTLDGRPLPMDHGYPVRLIAPNRPGVGQTKWVQRLEVV
jgi:hypothetical protein